MAKKQPKFDQKYIEKLKKKGLIGEDTYRLCMANGGVVPEIPVEETGDAPFFGRTLTNIGSALADGYSKLKAQTQAARSGEPIVPAASDVAPEAVPQMEVASVDPSELATPPAQGTIKMPTFDEISDTYGFDQMDQGLKSQMNAARKAAAEEVGTIQGYMDKAQELEAQSRAREQERLDAVERAEAEYLKASEEMKVDPGRFEKNFWGNASSGQKMIATIGLILGGAGSVEMLDRMVDRDIDAQKAEINKTLGAKKNLLQSMKERFGDERTAELASKRFLLDQAELKLKQIGAVYKGAEAQGRLQHALGELQLQRAKVVNEMQTKLYQRAMIHGGEVDEMTRKILALPEQFQKEAFKEKGYIESGRSAIEGTEKAFDDFAKISAIEGSIPFSEKKAKIEVGRASILANVVKSLGSNPSDRDMRVIEQMLPNKTDTVAQIRAKKKLMADFMKRKQAEINPTPMLKGFGIYKDEKLDFGDRTR